MIWRVTALLLSTVTIWASPQIIIRNSNDPDNIVPSGPTTYYTGTVRTPASCSAANVQTEVTAAVSRDIVRLPVGCSATWTSQIVIPNTKGIWLDGSTNGGATITKGTSSTVPAIDLSANSTISSRVSGITFSYSSTTGNPPLFFELTSGPTDAAFRIDHNSLSFPQDVAIRVTGGGPGLIDHNTLTNSSGSTETIHNEAFGNGSSTGWTTDVVPGGSNMLFIEDNTFVSNWSFTVASAIQAYYGARTVARYNDFTNMQIDEHGTGGQVGARWWEFYGNTFRQSGLSICCYFAIRAGSGVIFNNTRASGSGGMDLFEEDTGTWPVAYQIGSGLNGHTNGHATCTAASRGLSVATNQSPAYIWSEGSWAADSQTPSQVVANRDYIQSTNQPSTLFGINQSGDSCTSTYAYTPYTYPHPLQASLQ